jgi:phenylacetate-coenzyme A ligase PaaK-like adenylate-forming protein
MIRNLVARLWWLKYRIRESRSWSELRQFPRLNEDQQRRDLASRLLAQVRYFGTRADSLPEWRQAASITDPLELWTVWPSLPVMTKQILRDRFHPKEMAPRFGLQGRESSTGGSTGEPVHFFYDWPMVKTGMALNIYCRRTMGWHPGMPTVIIWGSERDIGKLTSPRARLNSQLLYEYLIDGYSLTDQTVDRMVEVVTLKGPAAVYGMTSMLEFVARRFLERGLTLPPGRVAVSWCGGEMLFPEQSELFRRAFGVPILNLYGGREMSALACQFRAGAPLEILRPWQYVEIVDDQGRPVPPGQSGRILWTSTVCRGTPFLRYEIGDLASYGPSDHNTSGITAFRELQGRTAGLLHLPDGRTISALYWNHAFKEFSEIQQFQVKLKRDGQVEILLIAPGVTPERATSLQQMLRHLLQGVPFHIHWVDRIPRTSQGKLVQVVKE